MKLLAPFFFAVLVAGCATTPERTAIPIVREAGKPVVHTVLGARYELPARWDLPDSLAEPGFAWIDFVDNINTCSGSVVWKSTTDGATDHQVFGKFAANEEAGFKTHGVSVDRTTKTAPILTREADVRLLKLTEPGDTAAKAIWYSFHPDQNLVIKGDVFCGDPGFIDEALQTSLAAINTQTR